MPDRDFQNELYNIGEKLLNKLQRLLKADVLEIAFFLIIVLFIATIIVLMLIACGFCCFECSNGNANSRGRRTRIQPTAHK